MSNFRFKELGVSLTPLTFPTQPGQCGIPNLGGPELNIIVTGTCCGGGASLPDFQAWKITLNLGDPIFPAEGFELLKTYLRIALEKVEASENLASEGLPHTVAELDMLEQKLTGALEELRTQKAELRKNS